VLHALAISVNFSRQLRSSEVKQLRRDVQDQSENFLAMDCAKHFGFGRGVLYDTLISPTHLHVK